MSEVIGYGIDFGTTNSSLSIAFEDRVEILPVYPSSPDSASLPSLVYLHRNGNEASGSEAAQQFLVTGSSTTRCDKCDLVYKEKDGLSSDCKQFELGRGCIDSRLVSGLKSELSGLLFTSTHSWAQDFSLEDLAAIVLRDLKRRGDRASGSDVRRVVVGHPIQFVGATGNDFETGQQKAVDRLKAASQLAGFAELTLYPEPAAAILDEPLEDGIAVSVDFGGGTFDVAVIEVDDGQGDILALQGAGIGGERFDGMLFDEYVLPRFGLDGDLGSGHQAIPNWFITRLRTLGGVRHLLSDKRTPLVISQLRSLGKRVEADLVEALLYGGHAYDFYRCVEQAKISLSSSSTSSVEFHRPNINVSIPMERSRFDAIISPDLDLVMEQIDKALKWAEVDASNVGAVVRTGGSSSIPAFVDRLVDRFGEERLRARPPLTSVAYGLGIVAQEEYFDQAG